MPPLNEILTRTKPELRIENSGGSSLKKKTKAKQAKVVDTDKVFELVRERLLEDAAQDRRDQMFLAEYRVKVGTNRKIVALCRSMLNRKLEESALRKAEVSKEREK
jgi:hypothetical protein